MHLTIVQTMSCTTERGFKCGATSGCSGETFFVSDISQARSFSYLYVLQWISFPSNGRMFIPPSPSSRHVCFICFLAYERVTWEVFWVGLLVKPPTRHRDRIHHTDCCWRVEITKYYSFRNGHFTVLRSFKMNGGNQDFYEILEHRDNLWESWLVGLGVWFSLRVREVPGSNPGRARKYTTSLRLPLWWRNSGAYYSRPE